MKVCANEECKTPIPEGKTRCPKCGQKKMVDVEGTVPAAPAAEAPKAEEKPEAEKTEKKPRRSARQKAVEAEAPRTEEPAKAEEPAKPAAAPAATAAQGGGDSLQEALAAQVRLRSALREARRRIRTLGTENRTLREELLSAGEMIENLAMDIEKPAVETGD